MNGESRLFDPGDERFGFGPTPLAYAVDSLNASAETTTQSAPASIEVDPSMTAAVLGTYSRIVSERTGRVNGDPARSALDKELLACQRAENFGAPIVRVSRRILAEAVRFVLEDLQPKN